MMMTQLSSPSNNFQKRNTLQKAVQMLQLFAFVDNGVLGLPLPLD